MTLMLLLPSSSLLPSADIAAGPPPPASLSHDHREHGAVEAKRQDGVAPRRVESPRHRAAENLGSGPDLLEAGRVRQAEGQGRHSDAEKKPAHLKKGVTGGEGGGTCSFCWESLAIWPHNIFGRDETFLSLDRDTLASGGGGGVLLNR